MLIIKDKWNLYIPEERKVVLNQNVMEKIEFLSRHERVKSPILGLPDFGDDGFGLNGIYFETSNLVFPMGPGKDVGCGFRLLHVKKEDVDKKRLEKEVKIFGALITEKKSGMDITKEDIVQLFFNPSEWMKKREIEDPFIEKITTKCDMDRPSYIKSEEVSRSIARVAKGNHFIEIREISRIENENVCKKLGFEEGDFLIHIHTGAGVFVENSILRHIRVMLTKDESRHGFLSYGEYSEENTQNYLADAERSLKIAVVNRGLLTALLEKWMNIYPNQLLDISHDYLEQDDFTIKHYKAVQKYARYKGEQIAIIPSTISDESVVVRRKGSFPFVNHGLGDGETGSVVEVRDVITNFEQKIKRKFYHAEPVFNLCHELGWYEPIVKIKPWICIKNLGEW